jgi:hypothetical protein
MIARLLQVGAKLVRQRGDLRGCASARRTGRFQVANSGFDILDKHRDGGVIVFRRHSGKVVAGERSNRVTDRTEGRFGVARAQRGLRPQVLNGDRNYHQRVSLSADMTRRDNRV